MLLIHWTVPSERASSPRSIVSAYPVISFSNPHSLKSLVLYCRRVSEIIFRREISEVTRAAVPVGPWSS